MLKKYIEYLKDNPEGYWFKAKWYGWGWTPAKREGWVVIAVYGVLVLALGMRVKEGVNSVGNLLFEVVVPVILLTLVLIGICYAKGEKPYWNWGGKRKQPK